MNLFISFQIKTNEQSFGSARPINRPSVRIQVLARGSCPDDDYFFKATDALSPMRDSVQPKGHWTRITDTF